MSIIGSSGSGKTTLLRCINFLETADSGRIVVDGDVIFDGENYKNMKSDEKREKQLKIGLVFQQFNLFPQYNVLDNVTLAVKLRAKERPDYKQNKKQILKEIDEKALKLLSDMGLSDKIDHYPCELSGGQQQRVSIARAMALEPKILFFDEPTSALDPELTGEILKVIRELAEKNMTMVIVTHEMTFAKEVSDYIVFMDNGVIAEEGEAQELINNPKTERLQAFLSKISD
jgi:polar amino acid transport system ATP-binding protein